MFLQDICRIFSQNCIVYPTIVGEIFKFMLLRILENAFASQKIECINFYSRPPQVKFSHRFLSSPPRQREITHLPEAVFFQKSVFPAESGEETMSPISLFL